MPEIKTYAPGDVARHIDLLNAKVDLLISNVDTLRAKIVKLQRRARAAGGTVSYGQPVRQARPKKR